MAATTTRIRPASWRWAASSRARRSTSLQNNFAAEQQYLMQLSDNYAALPANGSVTNTGDTLRFSGTSAGQNVFSVVGSQLQVATGVVISVPQGASVVVNITGSAISVANFTITMNNMPASKVLWNAANTTSFSVANIALKGSLLLPRGQLNSASGNFEGVVIAKRWNGASAGTTATFQPCGSGNPTPTPTKTPTPSVTPTATPTSASATCALYPIALKQTTLNGVAVGSVVSDILNGPGSGSVSWLSWTGAQGTPTLAASLIPPGNSHTYVNPNNPSDRIVSMSDRVRGHTGSTNSSQVRSALDALKGVDVIVPVGINPDWAEDVRNVRLIFPAQNELEINLTQAERVKRTPFALDTLLGRALAPFLPAFPSAMALWLVTASGLCASFAVSLPRKWRGRAVSRKDALGWCVVALCAAFGMSAVINQFELVTVLWSRYATLDDPSTSLRTAALGVPRYSAPAKTNEFLAQAAARLPHGHMLVVSQSQALDYLEFRAHYLLFPRPVSFAKTGQLAKIEDYAGVIMPARGVPPRSGWQRVAGPTAGWEAWAAPRIGNARSSVPMPPEPIPTVGLDAWPWLIVSVLVVLLAGYGLAGAVGWRGIERSWAMPICL